jgi:hypothetical protein
MQGLWRDIDHLAGMGAAPIEAVRGCKGKLRGALQDVEGLLIGVLMGWYAYVMSVAEDSFCRQMLAC